MSLFDSLHEPLVHIIINLQFKKGGGMMNRIDEIRKKKNLSYQNIASKCGVTPMYICLLAKGKRNNPSLDIAQKISEALEEKMEKVFISPSKNAKQGGEIVEQSGANSFNSKATC